MGLRCYFLGCTIMCIDRRSAREQNVSHTELDVLDIIWPLFRQRKNLRTYHYMVIKPDYH